MEKKHLVQPRRRTTRRPKYLLHFLDLDLLLLLIFWWVRVFDHGVIVSSTFFKGGLVMLEVGTVVP